MQSKKDKYGSELIKYRCPECGSREVTVKKEIVIGYESSLKKNGTISKKWKLIYKEEPRGYWFECDICDHTSTMIAEEGEWADV